MVFYTLQILIITMYLRRLAAIILTIKSKVDIRRDHVTIVITGFQFYSRKFLEERESPGKS